VATFNQGTEMNITFFGEQGSSQKRIVGATLPKQTGKSAAHVTGRLLHSKAKICIRFAGKQEQKTKPVGTQLGP